VHISAVEKAGHSTLAEGARVSYELQPGNPARCQQKIYASVEAKSESRGFRFLTAGDQRANTLQRQLRLSSKRIVFEGIRSCHQARRCAHS
jgi:hypothetical protein